MDKFSELKRLAEKCPVQHFEPFIGRAGGRGTQAIFNADTKGEVITWSGFDSSDVTSRTGREAIARFVAAVDPETVLALLAELERYKQYAKERDAENESLALTAGRLRVELEAKDKRIAGLERAYKSQDDHINQQQDRIDSLEKTNAGLGRGLAEAEKRLATPVRLPKRWDVSGQVNPPRIVEVQFEQQNRTHDQCAEAIRAAGFKIEGEE